MIGGCCMKLLFELDLKIRLLDLELVDLAQTSHE
jgi:hypothetical protein